MKRFEVHTKDDGEAFLTGRPCDWAQVKDLLMRIRSEGLEDSARYFVRGEEVSLEECLSAAASEGEQEQERKRETHREISWLSGYCENTRRRAWVRK